MRLWPTRSPSFARIGTDRRQQQLRGLEPAEVRVADAEVHHEVRDERDVKPWIMPLTSSSTNSHPTSANVIVPADRVVVDPMDGMVLGRRLGWRDDGAIDRGRRPHQALRREDRGRRRAVPGSAGARHGIPRGRTGGQDHDAADDARPRHPDQWHRDLRRAPLRGAARPPAHRRDGARGSSFHPGGPGATTCACSPPRGCRTSGSTPRSRRPGWWRPGERRLALYSGMRQASACPRLWRPRRPCARRADQRARPRGHPLDPRVPARPRRGGPHGPDLLHLAHGGAADRRRRDRDSRGRIVHQGPLESLQTRPTVLVDAPDRDALASALAAAEPRPAAAARAPSPTSTRPRSRDRARRGVALSPLRADAAGIEDVFFQPPRPSTTRRSAPPGRGGRAMIRAIRAEARKLDHPDVVGLAIVLFGYVASPGGLRRALRGDRDGADRRRGGHGGAAIPGEFLSPLVCRHGRRLRHPLILGTLGDRGGAPPHADPGLPRRAPRARVLGPSSS